ncbi:molecular chaperone HtpG [Lentisphaerota bacterium WC36G]|nr:molecular chaperone HtpG [Lentisphaerae bacterium WC36]
MSKNVKQFKTEVQHLLDLMIHSLYSNKDIFLREIIANAADAIDKARFEALTNKDINADWKVRIEIDKENNAIKVIDNGIGMTDEEVVDNIGTIAKSGTKAFMKAMEESSEADLPELIGQFGVGFYSSFMVADKVELVTRKVGETADKAVKWTSNGKESYELENVNKSEHGTTVTIFLNKEFSVYTEEYKIKTIIKKYSDYIEYPIEMPITKLDEEDEGKEIVADEIINSQKAIWLRNPSDVTEEEYRNFFEHLAHFGEPLRTMHYVAEGKTEFKALLYLPKTAPMQFYAPDPDARKHGLHLYVKRVFITDECKELIPEYLRFVKGVVDSSDLPLNVSREILQENALLGKIQSNVVRKILSELKKTKNNSFDEYYEFFKEFGKTLKEGIATDNANREKLQELLIFESMNTDATKMISFADYVQAMPESQKEIYYITGESRNMLENSPHLEQLKSKGYDVLFMTDPIDEWVVQHIHNYADKKLQAVGKGEIDLGDTAEVEEQNKEATEKHKTLLEYLQKTLDVKVKEVRFSKRLTDSACCLVADQYDPSAQMERIFKAMNQDLPESKRILELNANHPLVDALQGLYDANNENPVLGEYAEMIYDQAVLTEGGIINDPLKFTQRVSNLMVLGAKNKK